MTQSAKVKEHVQRYLSSGGEDGHLWDRLAAPGTYPCLLLTTKGRKSGELRTTPLVYGRDGVSFVVVASQGGRPTHPAWYLNLEEDPCVSVQVCADRFRAIAHRVLGDERNRLWQLMGAVYHLMDEYEKRIGNARVIPVVKLTPI